LIVSWQDRDYAKGPQYAGPVSAGNLFGGSLAPRSVATTLIWVNVAVYVLCSMTSGGRPVAASPIFQFGAMTVENVMSGQIWRLVTSDYLHWNFWHIFANMLGLFFLGRPLEQVWGPKKFFAVYSIAGILGSLFFMLLVLVGWLGSGPAAGASGCILGLLGAAAAMFPHAKVYIYFLFPVKIRVVAAAFTGWYILNIFRVGDNAGGDACHLAGMIFGVWFALKGDRWWSGRGRSVLSAAPRFVTRPARSKPVGSFRDRIRKRQEDALLVDRILAKVRTAGIASLTDGERRALAEATQRLQETH